MKEILKFYEFSMHPVQTGVYFVSNFSEETLYLAVWDGKHWSSAFTTYNKLVDEYNDTFSDLNKNLFLSQKYYWARSKKLLVEASSMDMDKPCSLKDLILYRTKNGWYTYLEKHAVAKVDVVNSLIIPEIEAQHPGEGWKEKFDDYGLSHVVAHFWEINKYSSMGVAITPATNTAKPTWASYKPPNFAWILKDGKVERTKKEEKTLTTQELKKSLNDLSMMYQQMYGKTDYVDDFIVTSPPSFVWKTGTIT